MRRLAASLVAAAALLASARAQPTPGTAQPRDLAAYLPAETALLLETDDLAGSLATLRELVGPLPVLAELGEGALRLALWHQLGVGLDGLIETLAPGPAALAVVLPPEGRPLAVWLSRITDIDAIRALGSRVPNLGVHAADGLCAVLGTPHDLERWQRFVQGDHPRLAARPGFRAGCAPMPAHGLRLHVDVALLRARNGRAWEGLDPGGRVLVGPIAAALDAATRFDAVVALEHDRLHLDGQLDGSTLGADPQRHLLAAGDSAHARVPQPEGTLAALTLDRSLRGYLTHLDALLPAAAAARARGEFANFDLILGGGSFVDDLLGGLAEPMTLFVVGAPVPPSDDEAPPRPRVDLPGFALVAKVETERAAELLTKGFYRLSAIITGQRGQRRLPPRLAQPLRDGALRLHVMRGPAFPGVGQPPTDEQIESTLVCAHGYAVIATTETCARQVVAALATGPGAAQRGDELHLAGAAIADYLRRNASALELGRVLDEGESLERARMFTDALIEAAARVQGLTVRVEPDAAATRVSLEIVRGPR